jgi:L-lactate utilization protein LutB
MTEIKTEIRNREAIERTVSSLKTNGFEPVVVSSGADALSKIKELIPAGVSVMNGASKTLEDIGFIEYLKSGEHGWNNLHAKVYAEPDRAKQGVLRKEATIADYALNSVQAVTEKGEILIASNTGSQLPAIAFNSHNIIVVVGAQKIVPDLTSAFVRLEKDVMPLEDERIKALYGINTMHAKSLILHKENPMMGRKVYVIIVEESLGF